MKLELSLFKFDAKSDYLPYYTKHYVKIKDEKNLLDILQTIHTENPLGFEANESFGVVVNGVYTTLNLSIEAIKKDFGCDLQIEPLSIKRAYSDLLINQDDFYEKLETLSAFITEEDRQEYENYKLCYYASNTLNFNGAYIGDAVLLLAASLIQKQAENKTTILKAISDKETGIAFHTSLSNRVYALSNEVETTIVNLQEELNLLKEAEKSTFINGSKNINFDKPCGTSIVKHSFKAFNIAYYNGKQGCQKTENLLCALDAKYLKIPSMSNDVAKETFHINQEFTYKLTAEVILDAFDHGADFIVVDNEADFYLFDSNRKALEAVSGREVTLPVIHSNELSKLVCGLHDDVQKTLVLHSVNPQII